MITDITERKAAEDALSRTNKKLTILSSITRHDIKNQLMALSAYLESLKRKTRYNVSRRIGVLKTGMGIAQIMGHQIDFTKAYENMGNNSPRLAEHQCKCPAGSCRPAHAGCTGGG